MGFVKSVQQESYVILRKVRDMLASKGVTGKNITLAVHRQVSDYLINLEYNAILGLEKTFGCKITLAVDDTTQRLNVYAISGGTTK